MNRLLKITFGVVFLGAGLITYQNCGTDGIGNSSSSTLSINPATTTVGISSSTQLTASGGTQPFSFYIYSGSGSVTTNGYFTASSVSGFTTVAVKDSLGTIAYAYITVSGSGTVGGGAGSFSTSPGINTVCCPAGTTVTSFTDSGTGSHHGIFANNPTAGCCTAWEGPNNGGGPGCTITCQ